MVFKSYVDSLTDKENVNNTTKGKVTRMKQLCREALNIAQGQSPLANFNFQGSACLRYF